MEWVPAYLDLWVDDKADLSHATRSIFLRLCLAARRACRDGLVPLPPSSPNDEGGVLAMVHGKPTEVRAAIAEMIRHDMIAFETSGDCRCVRILSWTAAWVLDHPSGDDISSAEEGHSRQRRGGRPRKWTSEADRKRARREAAKSGNLPVCPETCPETNPDASGNLSGNQYPDNGGGKGGASPPDQKKVSEITRNGEKTDARALASKAGADGQMVLPGSGDAAKSTRKRSRVTTRSPVTEVRDIWIAEWAAVGMPGPAPWGREDAAVAKGYLEAPGASVETARQAIAGMMRTPAGQWHRTHEGGRHATARAALAGARGVEFTGAGKAWLEAQAAASRPRREPPPPDPIPQIYVDLAEQDRARGIVPPWERKKPANLGGGDG